MRSIRYPEMSSQVEGNLMEKAIEATNHLYHIRDTYFPANPDDKLSKLRTQSDIALKLLDSIPHGTLSYAYFDFAFFFFF